MATKDYIGCCGACMHCSLTEGYTFCYKTTFPCKKHNRSVCADERACDRFEPGSGRTNELIAKYDK